MGVFKTITIIYLIIGLLSLSGSTENSIRGAK